MNGNRIELNPTQTVLVIGGRGFIGRNIVEQLEKFGANVLIGSRNVEFAGQHASRKARLQELQAPEDCKELLEGVDVVINAVGILRQRSGESYEQVHHLAVNHLVNACADKGIRFLHVSALGLYNPTKSRFLSSKRLGEQAIQNSDADWHICRASLVDGDDGYGAKWFRRVARWPIHFAPANAVAKLAPIHVKDLGEAIAKIALKTDKPKTVHERLYELGGEHEMTVLEYLHVLKQGCAPVKTQAAKTKTLSMKVPAWLARVTSHVLDLLHLTPYSFGHYELLKFDNIPKTQQATLLLGRPCRALG